MVPQYFNEGQVPAEPIDSEILTRVRWAFRQVANQQAIPEGLDTKIFIRDFMADRMGGTMAINLAMDLYGKQVEKVYRQSVKVPDRAIDHVLCEVRECLRQKHRLKWLLKYVRPPKFREIEFVVNVMFTDVDLEFNAKYDFDSKLRTVQVPRIRSITIPYGQEIRHRSLD